MYEYIGNLHIHSNLSDGWAGIGRIARAAGSVGLDFVCITDHDFMAPSLPLEEEGFYGKVLVLVGLEIGERHHHYLAYDLKEMIRGRDLKPQEVIDRVRRQSGFGFLAHPFEKGMPLGGRIAYTWKNLSVTGYTGMEIWNFMSRWKERVKTIPHGLLFLTFKCQLLKPPSRTTMAVWDLLCRRQKVVAVGGSDAHASLYRHGIFSLRPFSYEFLLSTINVHIFLQERLPRDLVPAKEAVYGALRAGRLFIAHDRIAPARGFRFEFVSDRGPDVFMGEEDDFEPGYVVIDLPCPGEIRFIRNGRVIRRNTGIGSLYRVEEPGVYRVEVYKNLPFFGLRPWIYTNPVYLR